MIPYPRIEIALDAMEELARRLIEPTIKGVAVILELTEDERRNLRNFTPMFKAFGPYQRLPDLKEYGPDDQGSNYLAIAWAKVAEMVRTGKPSGRDSRLANGEIGFRGGIPALKDGVWTFVAFSGGSANQDMLIALEGLRSLGLYDNIMS